MACMKLTVVARVGLALALTSAFVPSPGNSALLPASNPKCRDAVPNVGTAQEPLDDGLRVATLNSLHGLDDDPEGNYPSGATLDTRIDMQATQLAEAKVDVVGMQEVSTFKVTASSPLREVASDLAEALAEKTGQRWWWCWYLANPYFTGEPDVNEGGGGPLSEASASLVSTFAGGPYAVFHDGIAVLSRYEITDKEGVHLSPRVPAEIPLCIAEALPTIADDPAAGPLCAAVAGFERRSALWVRAKTPGGDTELTTTHLAHHITSASGVSSLGQGLAAVAFAQAHTLLDPPARVFFACDCNSEPTATLVAAVEALGWTNSFIAPCAAATPAGCTAGPDKIVFHGVAADRVMTERIDYVFSYDGTCTENGHLIVNDAVPYTDTHGPGWLYPTDHIGVAADVATCYP
jgi:endonuclease/exonuclease/phosphatase family metal-dependent hydrolase